MRQKVRGCSDMSHWTEKYLSLEYSKACFDCADLVQHVLKNEQGFDMPLPDDRTWRGRSAKSLSDFSRNFALPVDAPVEFCGVLMKIQGHRRNMGSHIGIASIVNGVGWVLHAMSGVGVVFCPVKNLYRFRLELVGYYEWER